MPEINQNQNPVLSQPAKPQAKTVEQVGLRVSLIPAEEINRRDPRKGFRNFIISSSVTIGAMVLIIGILGVLVYMSRQQVAKIKTQTAAYETQTAALADALKDAQLTQTRLRAMGSLLGAHRNAAPILVFLEKNTLPDVAFSSISIAENGTVNLAAAAGSFESYAAQINVFRQQDLVKSLVSSGLSPIYDGNNAFQQLNFTVAINFDQSIFVSSLATK